MPKVRRFEDLLALSKLLFVRGDLLGRIADHDRAEPVAERGRRVVARRRAARSTSARGSRSASIASRKPTRCSIERSPPAIRAREIDRERAALFQATGRYREALALRETTGEGGSRDSHARRARVAAGGDGSMGGGRSLLCGRARRGRRRLAPAVRPAALRMGRERDAPRRAGPCGGDLRRARRDPAAHVPGRGHRAEVALARGQLDVALALITPLLEISDDPEYRATYAEILAARGEREAAAREAERAAAAYESLLARRPEAYADHAAAFFMGIGNRPQLALELAGEELEAPRHATLAQSSGQGAAVRSSSRAVCARIISRSQTARRVA